MKVFEILMYILILSLIWNIMFDTYINPAIIISET